MKQTFSIAFKQEVIRFLDEGHSSYEASRFFSAREKFQFDPALFRKWYKQRAQILNAQPEMKRVTGGGRKRILENVEQIIADEVEELRVMKLKVTRHMIRDRALMLAEENNIQNFNASEGWISDFMGRFGFSLRRTTNLTTLDDNVLIDRYYFHHL